MFWSSQLRLFPLVYMNLALMLNRYQCFVRAFVSDFCSVYSIVYKVVREVKCHTTITTVVILVITWSAGLLYKMQQQGNIIAYFTLFRVQWQHMGCCALAQALHISWQHKGNIFELPDIWCEGCIKTCWVVTMQKEKSLLHCGYSQGHL